MSQTDFIIPNSPLTMVQLKTKLEEIFGAQLSQNSGTTAPANPIDYMVWADTSQVISNNLVSVKMFFPAENGWKTILEFNLDTGELKKDGAVYHLVAMESSEPTGSFLNGDKYYNTTSKQVFTYSVSAWVNGKTPSYGELYESETKLYVWDGTDLKRTGGGGESGGEIGDVGLAPFGIDETLNLRRYLNGQVISQSQFASFTTKLKASVALHPSLATTEANWQSEKSLSKLGQCGRFVIDDDAGTIRLPCVVNAQGLTDLALIGGVKAESLPNITGDASMGLGTSYGLINSNATPPSGAFKRGTASAPGNSSSGTPGSAASSFALGLDASLSSSTYQDNAPVQQEAVQYPYYIQVATGVEETLPAIREYEINNPFFFGQSMYFENDPYNASWLASNGQYNASSLYPDFWTQLTGVELNGSLNVGDTIEIGGKTYVKRGLPVELSTDTYTDYDFVINTGDSTFRLPLLNGEGNGTLYYYVGDTVQDASLINAGAVLSDIADLKAHTTVDTWRSADGSSWYRKYSDGFIEQGGFTSGRGQTITFLNPFTVKPVVSFAYNTNTVSQNYNYVPLLDVSTTKIVVGNATVQQDNVTSWCWYACGY
jgi:hypothetical protein